MQAMLKKLKEKNQEDGGFTLIELLVVIVIIGILAGVVVFAVSGIIDRGETSACKADRETLTVAEETNYAQHATYADMATLVANNFLQGPSTKHTISVTPGPAPAGSYTVSGVGACP